MAISRQVWMIAGSTGRVQSKRFRTVRVVVSSLSTVARSMGRSPLHRSQVRTGLAVDTAQGVWQHSTRNRQRAQPTGGTAMEIGPLTIESHPTPEDTTFLDDRLYEYNAAQTGVDNGQWLAIFVRDDQQRICAGIKRWTWCGSCYISALWVDERLRGHGVGTQLLQAAEQEAQVRGCQYVILDCYNFQAPGFYQKHGYEVFAVLKDHPRNHRNYYLRKRLP